MTNFKEALIDCSMFDIGYIGYQFTWERSQFGEIVIRERLDRVVATGEWFNMFPLYQLKHEPMAGSNLKDYFWS